MAIINLSGSGIPPPLDTIPDPPQELHLLGELEPLLARPRLAIVGSRKPTPYGRQVTQQLVWELAGQGLVIISGLAFGIDAIAHRSCLEAGGQTIAVLPSGLDSIYPAGHRQLATQIIERGGVLLTEYPTGSEAYKLNFIARNRLVSGLSDAVLIVEAAVHSGSLHTANFALEQGRTVMAVPGNITSPLSSVTNQLIRSGAVPITTSQDVLQALGFEAMKRPEPTEVIGANVEQQAILGVIGGGMTDGGQILALSGLTPAVFNQTLTMLEITGRIRPLGAGHWGLNHG